MKYTNLSSREKEVLELISQELTASQIATQLFISTNTVISHRRNLKSKLDVKSIAGLVRKGFERGFLQF